MIKIMGCRDCGHSKEDNVTDCLLCTNPEIIEEHQAICFNVSTGVTAINCIHARGKHCVIQRDFIEKDSQEK